MNSHKRLHVIQHVPAEGPAEFGALAQAAGYLLSCTKVYEGAVASHATKADGDWPYPAPDAFDLLLVLGGPMSVYDDPPWIQAELACIRQAIDAGKVVVGICFGAQAISAALGARVYSSGIQEIGWWPVERESLPTSGLASNLGALFPEQFTVFHWHGDTFDLPAGAVRLLSSASCRNQAYIWTGVDSKATVLALQCHLETSFDALENMLVSFASDVERSLTAQQKAKTQNPDAAWAVQTLDQMRQAAVSSMPAMQEVLHKVFLWLDGRVKHL